MAESTYQSRFLDKHKQIIDVIDTIQKDTLRDYFLENSKPYEQKKPFEKSNI